MCCRAQGTRGVKTCHLLFGVCFEERVSRDSEVGGKCSFRVGVGGERHIVGYPLWGDKLERVIDRERFGALGRIR